MAEAIQKPSRELSDSKQLLLGYLDYYRSEIGRKVEGLNEPELRSSCLPSGWTPLQLVKHLTHMEQRWFDGVFWPNNCHDHSVTKMSRVTGR